MNLIEKIINKILNGDETEEEKEKTEEILEINVSDTIKTDDVIG